MKRAALPILFCFTFLLFSQAILKIHSADILKQNPLGGKIIYGHVDIEYDVYRIRCDSAVVNKDLTNALLFRNIIFSDTARTIYCDNATVSKTPNGNMAFLRGNVRIKEKDIEITSNEASLNELTEKAEVSGSVVLSYFKFPSVLYCSDMEHDTKNGIITTSTADSVLYVDSLRYYKLYAKDLIYDINLQKLNIPTKFKAEAHDYDKPIDYHRQINPVTIPRIIKRFTIVKDAYFSANRGVFNFDPFAFETSGKCALKRIDRLENDTIYFSSGSINYQEASGTGSASGDVFIKKDKLNVTAGRSKYLSDKGIVKLFDHPVILYDKHEITGDSVSLLIEKDGFFPREATVYSNPFYRSVPDPKYPDEVNTLKGKLMDLWFLNKEISKIIVSKQAEGLYFVREGEKKSKEAANYLLGDILEINFRDGEIDKAFIKGGCEGIYYPGEMKKQTLKKIKK
jgi:lipopolysaccharide export system protein LptA